MSGVDFAPTEPQSLWRKLGSVAAVAGRILAPRGNSFGRSRNKPLATGVSLSPTQFDAEIERVDINSAEDMQRLSTIRLALPGAERLSRLDPFSREYREAALSLYAEIRGAEGYHPERDEKSFTNPVSNLFLETSPWNYKDTGYFSEFLLSWGHILRLMDLKSGGTVLEYGPGSGQILLALARLGVEVFGVDIDDAWLSLIERQADQIGVRVNLERNFFGKGFEGKTFDRILFFEAFHHSPDFMDLLRELRGRLNPGGYIVFCGEPILWRTTDSVPYPWGPRLDGASVYCIRKQGWMELGFTHDFFIEALRRTGYDVTFHPFHGCGRAVAYTARPGSGIYSADGKVGFDG